MRIAHSIAWVRRLLGLDPKPQPETQARYNVPGVLRRDPRIVPAKQGEEYKP